jgi:hypothetical protein
MQLSPRAGLCAGCQYVKVIQSARGSFFLLCERSKTDPRFNKYPVLPVLQCPGYEPRREEETEQK